MSGGGLASAFERPVVGTIFVSCRLPLRHDRAFTLKRIRCINGRGNWELLKPGNFPDGTEKPVFLREAGRWWRGDRSQSQESHQPDISNFHQRCPHGFQEKKCNLLKDWLEGINLELGKDWGVLGKDWGVLGKDWGVLREAVGWVQGRAANSSPSPKCPPSLAPYHRMSPSNPPVQVLGNTTVPHLDT